MMGKLFTLLARKTMMMDILCRYHNSKNGGDDGDVVYLVGKEGSDDGDVV